MIKPIKIITFMGFLFVILIALGQLQRISIGNGAIYVHEIVMLCWFVWGTQQLLKKTGASYWKQYLLRQIKTPLKRIKNPQAAIPFLFSFSIFALSIWIGLGWLNHWFIDGFSVWPLLYSGRLLLYCASGWYFYRVYNQLLHEQNEVADEINTRTDTYDKKQILAVIHCLIAFLLITLVAGGWLQWLFVPDLRPFSYLGWDDHLYRMTGTQLDPNFFGALLICIWWGWFYFHKKNTVGTFSRSVGTLSIGLFIILSIYLTYSRTTYIAWIISILVALINIPSNWLKHTAAVMVLILCILCMPKPDGEGGKLARTSTIESRQVDSLSRLLHLQSRELLLGKGLFTIDTTSQTHAKLATSLPVIVIEGIGLSGVGIVSILIMTFGYIELSDRKKRVGWVRFFAEKPHIQPITIALLIHSLANPTLIQPFVLTIYLVLLTIKKK